LYFYYADEGLIGEFDAMGASVRQYGYVPDSTWTTAPLYLKTSQGYSYYQNDHLGTPQQLIQKNGAKVWEGEFRAFGELTAETGSWENRLRFPGQYYDEETNNYYNYFREYDPKTGRYLESDPIGLKGGVNLYAYSNMDPVVNIDPLGLAYWRNPKTGYYQQKPKKKKYDNKDPEAKRDNWDDAANELNDSVNDDDAPDSEYLYVTYCTLARCYYECGEYRDFGPGDWVPCGVPKETELPGNCVCFEKQVKPYQDTDNPLKNIIKSRRDHNCKFIRDVQY
jgi:RHS repeat-associated protein